MLNLVLDKFNEDKRDKYFASMDKEKQTTDEFIRGKSIFKPELSFLWTLRLWNSYTPAVPTNHERDLGGGYFLWHYGQGVVIDPGYDFITLFHQAGGHLCDINHIIVTHAHDDHTASLEQLLMLLHRMRKAGAKSNTEDDEYSDYQSHQINLYISASVLKKFSGMLTLTDKRFTRVVVLTPPKVNELQQVVLHNSLKLTTLPAYHDDVYSYDSAIGFLLTCTTQNNGDTNILFTGDTGYFPPKIVNGEVQKTKTKDGEYIVQVDADDEKTEPKKALSDRYRDVLLVRRLKSTCWLPI